MYLLPGFFLASLAPSYIAPLNRRFDTILAWALARASIPLADVILVIVEALVFNVLMSRKRWT